MSIRLVPARAAAFREGGTVGLVTKEGGLVTEEGVGVAVGLVTKEGGLIRWSLRELLIC
ncbi:hypothetical protein Hanom_Chr03g00242571 [Helianthus anomalus]